MCLLGLRGGYFSPSLYSFWWVSFNLLYFIWLYGYLLQSRRNFLHYFDWQILFFFLSIICNRLLSSDLHLVNRCFSSRWRRTTFLPRVKRIRTLCVGSPLKAAYKWVNILFCITYIVSKHDVRLTWNKQKLKDWWLLYDLS